MDLDDERRRAHDAKNVRVQRDAAEAKIPTERLRRVIREAFAREDARKSGDEREAGTAAEPGDPPEPDRQ